MIIYLISDVVATRKLNFPSSEGYANLCCKVSLAICSKLSYVAMTLLSVSRFSLMSSLQETWQSEPIRYNFSSEWSCK